MSETRKEGSTEKEITHGLDTEIAGEHRADLLGAQFRQYRQYRQLRDGGNAEQATLARSVYQATFKSHQQEP